MKSGLESSRPPGPAPALPCRTSGTRPSRCCAESTAIPTGRTGWWAVSRTVVATGRLRSRRRRNGEPLPEGVLSVIASPEESALVAQLMAARRGIHWDTVLFSAKESIYKAWFAFTGERLGFGDARVVIDGSRRTFAARILAAPSTGQGRRLPRRDDGVSGRIGVSRGLVLTAVSIGWGRSSSEPPAFRDERAS